MKPPQLFQLLAPHRATLSVNYLGCVVMEFLKAAGKKWPEGGVRCQNH